MKTSVVIPIHSFVDVITNSSSEIFVAADQSTVKAIKKLVENLIAATGGTSTADDLFTFELVTLCYNHKYDEVYLTASEIKAKRKELDEIQENAEEKYTEQQVEDAGAWEFKDGDDGYAQTSIRVEVKDKTNKSAVAAAKVLSDLTALYSIESQYN